MHRWWRFAFFVLSLLVSACSSATNVDEGAADSSVSEPEETSAVAGDVVVAAAAEPDVPDVPGAPLNRFDLQLGQCFNEGSWYDEALDRRVDLTATVACTAEHQSEVYHEAEFPAPNGAPFPGDTKMTEWSTQVCYDAFAGFVDAEYEVSTFEIGIVQPTVDTFEHPVGRHRRVFCYLFDTTAETTSGSARGSGV